MQFGPNPMDFPASAAAYAAGAHQQHRHSSVDARHAHPYVSTTGHRYGHSYGVHHSIVRHTHPNAMGVHRAPKLPVYDPDSCCTGKFQQNNAEFYSPLPSGYAPALPSAVHGQMSQLDTHAGPNTEQTLTSKYYDQHSVSTGRRKAQTIMPRKAKMSDQEKQMRKRRRKKRQARQVQAAQARGSSGGKKKPPNHRLLQIGGPQPAPFTVQDGFDVYLMSSIAAMVIGSVAVLCLRK
jgi:hypothetical protein